MKVENIKSASDLKLYFIEKGYDVTQVQEVLERIDKRVQHGKITLEQLKRQLLNAIPEENIPQLAERMLLANFWRGNHL